MEGKNFPEQNVCRRGSGESSDTEWEFVESPHTRVPLPYLIESNFSPPNIRGLGHDIDTDAADAALEAGFEEIHIDDIPSTISGHTDSTVKATVNHTYPAVGLDGVACRLTVQALEAIDRQSRCHYIPGNIQAWAQGGVFPPQLQDSSNHSDVAPGSSRSSSSYAASSWGYAASSFQSPADDYIAGAGALFEGHSTLYLLYGPEIPDFLVKET